MMGRAHASREAAWIVGVIACAALIAAFVLRNRFAMPTPQAVTVTSCQGVQPNNIRVDSDFGIAFDVPSAQFVVRSASSDMPPGERRRITLKDGAAELLVWRDDPLFFDLKSAFPVMSKKTGARTITNHGGAVVGRDIWGYLNDGERWRYITFRTGTAAGYRPMPVEQADALDQVLSSACLSPIERVP